MKKLMERFLPQADRQIIESCIREAESRTRGEIMIVVVPASSHYPVADLRAAAAFAFPLAVALTPMLGGLFWTGPFNLWIFLGALIPLFLVVEGSSLVAGWLYLTAYGVLQGGGVDTPVLEAMTC